MRRLCEGARGKLSLERDSRGTGNSVQYKELKLGSHSGHAKTNLSGHCVKMSGHCFLKVTPILKYMIWYNVANKILNLSPTCLARSPPQNH